MFILINGLAFGVMIFCVLLLMKRLKSPNTPTSRFSIGYVFFVMTFYMLIVRGLIAHQWPEAIVQLLAVYVAIWSYMVCVGDIAYYQAQRRAKRPHVTTQVQAPEDSPDWPTYRP